MSSSTRSGASACICAWSPGPPTAAISSSSGGSTPRTSLAACRIDARMIAPESTTVPSRSKRTTGNRTKLMLAAERADPDRPTPDVLDRQDRVHPGVSGEALTDLVCALSGEDEQRRAVIRIADRPAENDYALGREAVDVCGMFVPAILLAPGTRTIPFRPRKLGDDE